MSDARLSKLQLMRFIHETDREEVRHLRAYARQCREEKPIPEPSAFNMMEQAQQRIVADLLRSWQRQRLNAFAKQEVEIGSFVYTLKPRLAVFSSNMPGLAAAQIAFDPSPPALLLLLDEEYSQWIKQLRNYLYKSHWHFFCEFCPILPPLLRERNVTYNPGLRYWEQYSGTMFAGKAGSGEKILWQWDGQSATKCDGIQLDWNS